MPEDVAVLTAPSAGAETTTADAPVSSPSTETPATPDYATTSDEQILESATPAKPEAEAATPKPEGDQEQPKAEEAKTEEQIAEDGRVVPAKWREAFKADPELRALFFRDRANTEKLTALNAELPVLREAAQAVEKTDTAFLSADPAQQEPIIAHWAQQSPAAVASAIRVADSILKKANPDEFAQISTERFVAGMKEQEFDKFFGAVKQAIDADDTESLKAIGQGMLAWGQKFGFQETKEQELTRRAKEVEAKESSLKTREQKDHEASVKTFKSTVDSSVDTALAGTIKETLDHVLKTSAFTDGAKGRIAKEIDAEVRDAWTKDGDLAKAFTSAASPQGKLEISNASRDRQVSVVSAWIKNRVPSIAKKVIDNFTNDFIAAQQQRSDKVATAASRKDVHGGAPQQREPKKLDPKDIDYRKMSDEDILSA